MQYCWKANYSAGIVGVGFRTRGPFLKAITLFLYDGISQDGIFYFLNKARAMSVDDAVDVVNDELDADSAFRDCWSASLDVYEGKLESNPVHDWEHLDAHCHWALIFCLLEAPNIPRRMNRFCREALRRLEAGTPFPIKIYGSSLSERSGCCPRSWRRKSSEKSPRLA